MAGPGSMGEFASPELVQPVEPTHVRRDVCASPAPVDSGMMDI